MCWLLSPVTPRPPNDWVDAFGDVLRPALRRMSQTELCALLQALASLQVGAWPCSITVLTNNTCLLALFLPATSPTDGCPLHVLTYVLR